MDNLTLDDKGASPRSRGENHEPGEVPRSSPWLSALVGALCVMLGVTASALFLPHQSLWNDEAVQMFGLSLRPSEQVRWLMGLASYEDAIMGDRMPPLSYWAGWAWSQAFGLNETSMRWMGVAEVALATLLVFLAAREAWGLGPGLAAGLLFGLSPNVIVQAVEIRAYPLFLLASAAAFFCTTRLLADPMTDRPKWLAGLVACGVVAMYTHFFGLVLVGGAILAALVLVPARGGRVRSILLAAAVVGLVSLGLVPFILASIGVSGGGTGAVAEIRGPVRLVYRLIAHPATSISRVAVGLALLGAVVAGLAALTPKRRSPTASTGLLIALASGGAAVIVVHLAQSMFVAAEHSYNVWMLPALLLWLTSGLAASSRAGRGAARAGIALLLAADVYGAGQLAVNGDFFAHTPYHPIETLIRRLGHDRVALIHDAGDPTVCWEIYSPVRYEFEGAVRQFVVKSDPQGPLRVADYPDRKGETDPLAIPADYLIVVRAARQGAAELAEQVRNGVRPLGDGPVTKALKSDGRWLAVTEATYSTFVQSDVYVFMLIGGGKPL
jgi:hypothetical protein